MSTWTDDSSPVVLGLSRSLTTFFLIFSFFTLLSIFGVFDQTFLGEVSWIQLTILLLFVVGGLWTGTLQSGTKAPVVGATLVLGSLAILSAVVVRMLFLVNVGGIAIDSSTPMLFSEMSLGVVTVESWYVHVFWGIGVTIATFFLFLSPIERQWYPAIGFVIGAVASRFSNPTLILQEVAGGSAATARGQWDWSLGTMELMGDAVPWFIDGFAVFVAMTMFLAIYDEL